MPSDCKRHLTENKSFQGRCPICRLEVEMSHIFGDIGGTPRYRYWRIKRSAGRSERTFEYTTETADKGKYWAIERRWVRQGRGELGKIVRRAGFKTRKKAKARAYEWYTKARTPAPVEA